MDTLVAKAEEVEDIYHYYTALIYLNNITDESKRAAYLERLNAVKARIEAKRPTKTSTGGGGGYPTSTYGNCTFQDRKYDAKSGTVSVRYGVCVPENYHNTGIPLIVWLHGSGEVGCSMSTLRNSGLPTVVENWNKTGLKEIPAIVLAPILPSGQSYANKAYSNSIKDIMEDIIKEYNVNRNNISLIGHSLGGSGVYHVGTNLKDYFKAVVVLSGYINSPSAEKEWWKTIPLKGYSESGTSTKAFLTACGKPDEYKLLKVSHGAVPKAAATLDENNDGVSDMFYFMLSQGGSYPEPTKEEEEAMAPNCEKHDDYKLCSPKRGKFGSFAYYDANPSSTSDKWSLRMDPNWQNKNLTTLTTPCSSGLALRWTIHVNGKEKFKAAQEKLCELTTTGMGHIKYKASDFEDSGSLAIRFIEGSKSISLHSYGIAVDLNYNYSVTINGRTYKPYQRNAGEYQAFIDALGDEDDTRNINYIIWKKVFEPLGFDWGGNWGRNGNGATYDGCHFELKY
jgi:pimeloyl-ACP methyl ester carboxylesterase